MGNEERKDVVSQNELKAPRNAVKQVQLAERLLAEGNLAAAAPVVARALKAYPDYARALFQQGRINRVGSKLAQAEADFRQVNAAFPRDRLTLQQLGELSKIRNDYQAAKEYFQQILSIDPEDVGAHYNMMLLYRKTGMKTDAEREEKVFLDLKEDPRTTALAADFLQHNQEVARRSLPYYVNDLKLFNPDLEKAEYLTVFGSN